MDTVIIPRRNCLWALTPVEKHLSACIDEIEKMEADTRLTEAVILITKAMDKVADYIDGIE